MIREIVEKFRSIFKNDVKTVKQWEDAAQKSMKKQAFPLTEAIDSLHAAKEFDAQSGQDRVLGRPDMQRGQSYQIPQPIGGVAQPTYNRSSQPVSIKPANGRQEQSLADLMNMIRQQQQRP